MTAADIDWSVVPPRDPGSGGSVLVSAPGVALQEYEFARLATERGARYSGPSLYQLHAFCPASRAYARAAARSAVRAALEAVAWCLWNAGLLPGLWYYSACDPAEVLRRERAEQAPSHYPRSHYCHGLWGVSTVPAAGRVYARTNALGLLLLPLWAVAIGIASVLIGGCLELVEQLSKRLGLNLQGRARRGAADVCQQ